MSDDQPPHERDTDAEDGGFDFEGHRRRAVDAYQRVQARYGDCAAAVQAVLTAALAQEKVLVHSIESRAKTLTSFGNKAARPLAEDPSRPRYTDPLGEITDLSGVRVITFLLAATERVASIVETHFTVLEKINRTSLLQEQEKLGYQSIHYLVRFSAPRSTMPEYARFSDITTEIQVRTILQHTWAEIEHDIQYKAVEAIPTMIRRRFMSLAGLLEIADREFQAISDEDEQVRNDARHLVETGNLDGVEVTSDALRAYLDRRYSPDGRMSEWSYEWMAALLKRLGFINLAELDEAIAGYDDDKVSRLLWGSRQGQLRRLEDVLLASMGETFVSRHVWADADWYRPRANEHLEALRAHGIPIGTYKPNGPHA